MQVLAAPSLPGREASDMDWPHLASLRVRPADGAHAVDRAGNAEVAAGWERDPDWIAPCYRLTPRVERTGVWSALLDLGTCTDAEARGALCDLAVWLTAAGLHARIGIGPSGVLAQLVELTCASERQMAPIAPMAPIALLTPAQAPAFLRRVTVGALPGLHPHGYITPEIAERLQHYGLRTLGHLARIGELVLRRQFGAAGSFLAAVAQGRDTRPLCPTPAPAELRIRVRFATPATPEELFALLPCLAERATTQLCMQGRQARRLQLVVRWEHGGVERAPAPLILRQYTDSPTLLAQELQRLLIQIVPLLPIQDFTQDQQNRLERIEELCLSLAEFAPAAPAQATFWRTRGRQVAAIEDVAQTLARRHGRPILLRLRLATPTAIFSEDRYTPTDQRHQRHYLRPTETEHAGGVDGLSAASPDDAWRHVPQRLHWW